VYPFTPEQQKFIDSDQGKRRLAGYQLIDVTALKVALFQQCDSEGKIYILALSDDGSPGEMRVK
jgi:hypothetical protein